MAGAGGNFRPAGWVLLQIIFTGDQVLWWLAKYVQLLWSVSDSCLSELDAVPLTENENTSGNAFSSFILPPVGFLTVLMFSTDPTWCTGKYLPTYSGKQKIDGVNWRRWYWEENKLLHLKYVGCARQWVQCFYMCCASLVACHVLHKMGFHRSTTFPGEMDPAVDDKQ